ncbi:MAG: glutamyl-tRNA reductase, partial [Gemmataceae bacterium]
RILVANRSPEKAETVAAGCSGQPLAWEQLDDGLAQADIILSTTGAPEPIVTRERFSRIKKRRSRWPVVILDIAVPRDFDPRIHDGDRIYLFNIDDLKTIRDATLARRREHIQPAERIVEQEVRRFLKDWARRRHGPVIEKLTREFESRRQAIVQNLMSRLNGKLDDSDKQYIDKAFSLFQNQLLHGPISALREEPHDEAGTSHTLLDALRKLFRLD